MGDAGVPGTLQGGGTATGGIGGGGVESGGTAAVVAGAGDEPGTLGGTGGTAGIGGTGTQGGTGGTNGRGGTGTAGSGATSVGRIDEVDFRLTIENCAALEAECAHGVGCDQERHGFVVRDGDELVLVYASQSELGPMKLWPDGDHFSTNRSAYLELLGERAEPPVSLQAGPFEVWLTDDDADGVAETLRLEGPGTCYNGGDLDLGTADVAVALTGEVTTSTAHLEVRGDGWYAPLELWSDEPLALSSTATLDAPDGTSRAAMPGAGSWRTGGNDEYFFDFTVEEDVPRDTDLTWLLDAANTAGGRAPRSVAFHTEKAWVPLGQLGFEDGVDAHVVGSTEHDCDVAAEPPRVASSLGNIAALEGQVSLFVPAGLDVAILLDRPPGATKLLLHSIPLRIGNYDNYPSFGIRTRRGEAVVEVPWSYESFRGSGDGNDLYKQSGVERVVELALPEEKGDLLLEIHTTCHTGHDFRDASGAWLDALEFE